MRQQKNVSTANALQKSTSTISGKSRGTSEPAGAGAGKLAVNSGGGTGYCASTRVLMTTNPMNAATLAKVPCRSRRASECTSPGIKNMKMPATESTCMSMPSISVLAAATSQRMRFVRSHANTSIMVAATHVTKKIYIRAVCE